MSLTPGTRLGSYEILSPLGSGGMGEVYRAHDHKLGRDVAIKVLREEFASDRDRLARFEQEARAASALNHPHIVTIFDIGETDGRRYIAMELIRGRMLREMLQSGSFAVPTLLDFAVQATEGLAKAHEAGIVHRDLKPENLMVTEDGLVKILDFGLAKLMPRPFEDISEGATVSRHPTRSGTLLGTVEYMSPEQASGQPVDHRTDQFTLGVVLYEMATGERPFQRKTAAQTLAAIIEAEVIALDHQSAAIDGRLAAIVTRCLAKDPNQRFASTRELALALRDVKENRAPLVPAAAPIVAAGVPRSPEVVRDYYVQTDDGVKRMKEAKLRKKLRGGDFSGLELVRREGEERWEVLHSQRIFLEEVPVHGDPAEEARSRLVRGFAVHLASFLALGVFLTFSSGHPPFWMVFWGAGLVSHAVRAWPVMRERYPHLRGIVVAPQGLLRGRDPKQLLSQGFLEEAERVRGLLNRRGKSDKGRALLAEVDGLVESLTALAAKQADLEEQTAPAEQARVYDSDRDARAKLAASQSAYDRQLFQRQLDVLAQRRQAMDKARLQLERMRVRRSMAEHQLKQLRLDLSQAEARKQEAPELSSRILDIRREVDAFDEADELLARD